IRRATSLAERMGEDAGASGLRSIELIGFLSFVPNARQGRRGAGNRTGAFATIAAPGECGPVVIGFRQRKFCSLDPAIPSDINR
ncbi:hypothetical protein M3616_22875, partial [Bacillus velezensis]|nr:hypothetical protein [Bacillus velezensis]